MTPADVQGRSQLARYLSRSALPAGRELLLAEAIDAGAPATVTDRLRQLPTGREFGTVAEIWAALGGHNEAGRG